jgi:hypothetical protein
LANRKSQTESEEENGIPRLEPLMHKLTPDKTMGKMGKLCKEGLPRFILTEIPVNVKWLLVGKQSIR